MKSPKIQSSEMTPIKMKGNVARQLKQARQQKKLSLDAVASLTSVSKAMLGQIERQESSPTIATLWKISSGLGVSFSSFFTSQNLEVSAAVHFPEDPNMQVKTLFPFMEDTALEVFEITLLNHHRQLSSAHQQGVIEHVYVVSGCLSVLAGGEWEKINEGESTRFYADQPHGYYGETDKAVFQNIIRYL